MGRLGYDPLAERLGHGDWRRLMTQMPFEGPGQSPAGTARDIGPDADAREVIREALGENLFVEAGAGTGKTRALVDRIVSLVRSGVTIERIAAITFTERAAAELRERVRNGLDDEIAATGDPAGLAGRALASLDRAQISTIHSFCQAIVRTHAAEAGVDPDFDVQDELMTQRRMQERWRFYLEELGQEADARAEVDRLLSLGMRVDELEKLALHLASRGEVAEILAEYRYDAAGFAWPDIDLLLARLRNLDAKTVKEGDRLAQRVLLTTALLEDIADADTETREEVLAGGALTLGRDHRGTKGNWSNGHRAEALEVVEGVREELNLLLAAVRSDALAAVMPRIVQFVQRDERDRGREGKLTFDDLILRTRRVLLKSPEAVASLRQRLQVLLIDEFQDTDPLQVQIAKAFATDPRTGQIEPGRLFLVGDPKQSIYRFRRADMATYAQTRASMTLAGARLPQLRQNRRSRRVILDWVNSIFERLIGDGATPQVQPPYVAIQPARDADLHGAGVAVFGNQNDATAQGVRVIESEEVAAICRLVVEEAWQVQERSGETRTARYRDIAILIPRRTGLTALERALFAQGVPYRVEGGSLIYRTQEIRDLLNILAAIDNPADEVAVVAALRSPAFACSDVDLARHRAGGRRFNYHHPDAETWDGPVGEGLRALAAFHGARHDGSLAALVERVALDCGLIETGILDQGDRNSFRRARFMAERARAFEAAGPESLRAFVQWLEQQSGEAMMDNDGAGLDEDEDAVRVLTIHGSKGLEFPIVIMAGMAAQLQKGQSPTYSSDFAGRSVAVSIGYKTQNRRFTLGDLDALTSLEEAHADAEFNRLLYVAATRARDHLLVSLHHFKRSSQSAAQRLLAAGAESAPRLAVAPAQSTAARSQLEALEVELPPGLDASSFTEKRAALITGARTVRYTSATALAPRDEKKDEASDETEPWARGRGGTRLGRAVHAAIQSLPLDADDDTIAAFAKAQAVAEAIPHREKEVANLVRWVVHESDAWQRAKAARRAMREVPFAMHVAGQVLEGFVDLVIQAEDGIEIVDWKTDQVSAADVPDRLQKYELQAGLYVHGLESAAGIKVRRVTYVFASAKTEASPGEPGKLASAARERLAAGV